MHYAAYVQGNDSIIKLLVEAGADIDNKDNSGRTPLHYAAQNNFTTNMEALLTLGASITKRDNNGDQAYHLARDNGHLEAANLLRRHAGYKPFTMTELLKRSTNPSALPWPEEPVQSRSSDWLRYHRDPPMYIEWRPPPRVPEDPRRPRIRVGLVARR